MSDRILLGVTHPMTATVLLRGQLAALREAGFEVGLVVGSGPGVEPVARREGVTVFQIPMVRRPSPLTDLRSVVAFHRVVRQFRPDILSAGTPKAGLMGMLAGASRRTTARVYVIRGLPLETRRGAARWMSRTAERWAARCAHRVVSVSESLRRRVVDLEIAPAEKVTVLGPGSSNGVDEARFIPADPQTRQKARQGFSLPPEVPVIGFVGRLTRDKGIVDLTEIFFESVLPRCRDCHLLLVGDFEAEDPVPADARARLMDHPQVHVVGFTDHPELAYGAMDVLAFPSYREGFPNAPLESASCSVPVAGYSATGTVDAVVDGSTGTLVEIGNLSALAAALARYVEDPGLRERHGRLGRERVVLEFRREQVWKRWVDFYRDLLAHRRKARDK